MFLGQMLIAAFLHSVALARASGSNLQQNALSSTPDTLNFNCAAGLSHKGPPAQLTQTNSSTTVLDALKSNSSFTIFSEVIQLLKFAQKSGPFTGGSEGGVTGQPSFTIFVPIDAAFASLPPWVRASFERDRENLADFVKGIIEYHVVDRPIYPNDFLAGNNGDSAATGSSGPSPSTASSSPLTGSGYPSTAASSLTAVTTVQITEGIISQLQLQQQHEATRTSPLQSGSPTTTPGTGGASGGLTACVEQQQLQQKEQIQRRLQILNLTGLNKQQTRFGNLSVFLGADPNNMQEASKTVTRGAKQSADKQQTWEVNQAQILSFGNSSDAIIYGVNQVLTPLVYFKKSLYLLEDPSRGLTPSD